MKLWERPLLQLLAVFLALGGFAWWTFQSVSLPTALRDLLEEDEAIATAATPATEEERLRQEFSRLPAPPETHAPEVAALLQRLRALPVIPYALQVAFQRGAAAAPGQDPPPWNEAELRALAEAQAAWREAWQPFLFGPAPDWVAFPDSTALFRFRGDFLSPDGDLPGAGRDLRLRGSEVLGGDPVLRLGYLRQIRNLGSIHWNETDIVSVATRRAGILESEILPADLPLPTLISLRDGLGSAPSLEDLRLGLEADRALFLRAAQFLETLPPGTSATAGLLRWLGRDSEDPWVGYQLGRFSRARDLAAGLREAVAALDGLRQQTFLSGGAWRQWLAGNPETGFPTLPPESLAGFRSFEASRMAFLVACGALEVRLALENGQRTAARRVPDPARPGSFFLLEETPEEFRTYASSSAPGGKEPTRFRLPDSLRPNVRPAGEKTFPDAQGP